MNRNLKCSVIQTLEISIRFFQSIGNFQVKGKKYKKIPIVNLYSTLIK